MTWPAQAQTAPDPKRWIALIVLSMSLFIIVLDNTIVNVAVPTIVRELHTDVSALQWVISGYSLIFASLLISFGRIGDLIGKSVFVEIIFNRPGLGSLINTALRERNYPVVQAGVFVVVFLVVVTNAAVDLIYAWLDPRIRDRFFRPRGE